jgi:hypothetical protein
MARCGGVDFFTDGEGSRRRHIKTVLDARMDGELLVRGFFNCLLCVIWRHVQHGEKHC